MTKLFLYILASSKCPDEIVCPVPALSDCGRQIFFGPCKKTIRKYLRDNYLCENKQDDYKITEDTKDNIYLVGINGGPSSQGKKIVWAGRVSRIMTFEVAYKIIIPKTGQPDFSFSNMLKRRDKGKNRSPLHLKPLYDDKGKFIGYEHISEEHIKNDEWIWDVIYKKNKKYKGVKPNDRKILLGNEKREDLFELDCCFFCDTIFWAKGKGISINDKILELLRQHPDLKSKANEINEYTIFGKRKDDSADGYTGRYLEFKDSDAEKFIEIIRAESTNICNQR